MATNPLSTLPAGWTPWSAADNDMRSSIGEGEYYTTPGLPPMQNFSDAFTKAGFQGPMFLQSETGVSGEDRFSNPFFNPDAQAFADKQGWQTATQQQPGGWTRQGLFGPDGNLIQQQDFSNSQDNDFFTIGSLALAGAGGYAALGADAIGGAAAVGAEGAGGAGFTANTAGGGALGGAADYGAGTYAAETGAGGAIAASAEGGGADIGAGAAGGGGAVSNGATGVAKVAGSGNGIVDALQLAAPLLSGYFQSKASSNAADAQTAAMQAALKQQSDQYNQTRTDTAPWRAAGQASLDKLTQLLTSGELTSKFSGMNPMEEKGYAFAAKEGQRAIDNRAGGIGGDVLRASTRFAEDNATKYYNDAFNRFQTERTNSTNPLLAIAGLGTQGNQQVLASGTNAANQGSALNVYGGNAQGQNALTQGNIYGNAVNQLAGYGTYRNWPPPG